MSDHNIIQIETNIKIVDKQNHQRKVGWECWNGWFDC